jgi:hypothetical protein
LPPQAFIIRRVALPGHLPLGPAQFVKIAQEGQISARSCPLTASLADVMSARQTAMSRERRRFPVCSYLALPLITLLVVACSDANKKGETVRADRLPAVASPTAPSPVMAFIGSAAPGARSEFILPALGGRAVVEVGQSYDSAAGLVCKTVNVSPVDRSLPVQTLTACDEGTAWTVKGESSSLLRQ